MINLEKKELEFIQLSLGQMIIDEKLKYNSSRSKINEAKQIIAKIDSILSKEFKWKDC